MSKLLVNNGVMLNYAGNAFDAGDLVIGPQASIGLSK